MSVLAIVGAQWGDEGKGKIIDELAGRTDYVVRYQGGGNAGHRVVFGDNEFAFHLVPAGILHPHVTCIIGNGVVIDPRGLITELENLSRLGVDTDRLYISERAHVVMPYHVLLDRLEEESRGLEKIGTVLRGIGPAYVDKYSRVGIRMADLLDVDHFRAKLAPVLAHKNRMIAQIYGQPPLSLEEIHTEYVGYAQQLRRRIVDAQVILHKAYKDGRSILLEGAQGALLDVDFGTYPFVTSSSTIAGNAATGTGLPPRSVQHILGVYKAYITRVGSGPMPTELFNEEGERLRHVGHEYGTTTGRTRRCGWFDLVVGRFVARLNGFDSVAIMKLDVLDQMPTVKICTAYKLGDRELTSPPVDPTEFASCEPVYEEWPGWLCSTRGITEWSSLPENARRYLERIEELLETPLALISASPRRGETIHLRELQF
jgi:adenylosuccinate synthase